MRDHHADAAAGADRLRDQHRRVLSLADDDVFLVTEVAQRDRVETLHPIAKAVDYRHVTDLWTGGQGATNLAR